MNVIIVNGIYVSINKVMHLKLKFTATVNSFYFTNSVMVGIPPMFLSVSFLQLTSTPTFYLILKFLRMSTFEMVLSTENHPLKLCVSMGKPSSDGPCENNLSHVCISDTELVYYKARLIYCKLIFACHVLVSAKFAFSMPCKKCQCVPVPQTPISQTVEVINATSR